MTDISEISRRRMLRFLDDIKKDSDSAAKESINEIESFIKGKKYGLIWEEHSESADEIIQKAVPVFTEIKDRRIINDSEKPMNFLIEGDNLFCLHLLEKMHSGRIDLITIDPPYNMGKFDFRYDGVSVDAADAFKHSKWLSFMSKRLRIAKKLLSETGIIAINIDEHEIAPLLMLMEEIFGAENNLGTIIWNKQNPKGDSHRISVMHEYIAVFAKNNRKICELGNFGIRKKPHAAAILAKARQLYALLGKKAVPADVKELAKVYGYPDELISNMKVTYDLEMINKEFSDWLKRQDFSAGEKAYKYIDENGRVYRGVSMAWPNKKRPPDAFFEPLIHPVTHKPTPVPARGWRNSPDTMKKLLSEGRIIFGKDEKKQPERKYYLDENLTENTPSVYCNADSADKYMSEIGISFDYPKPVSEVKYLIRNLHPNPKVVLDFFAGSATTGHAVMEVNKEDGKKIQYILCNDNYNEIAEKTAYKRLKIESKNYSANLKYFRVDFVPKNSDNLEKKLSEHISEMTDLEGKAGPESVFRYFSSELDQGAPDV